MAPKVCEACQAARAVIVRPKNAQKLCKSCFVDVFETEIHQTIVQNSLFHPGEKVAIGASGGKDSTVLASVLKTLNDRHSYGLDLVLLSIDEGITGYRDDSLETVKRNAAQYGMPLTIVGYDELYGWTMDQVVEQIGKKGNCTYCGVFRRQALDRGAARLGIRHVVTGHNADDMAETVLMNLLRADLPRLSRATSIVTASAASDVKRSKPLKYAYEKEIVLYAHHQALDYFTTECIYSPEAFRGSARTLIKNLERIRPTSILDIVRSGEDMASLVPGSVSSRSAATAVAPGIPLEADEDGAPGCGTSSARTLALPLPDANRTHGKDVYADRETEVTLSSLSIQPRPKFNAANKGSKKQLQQTLRRCERCGYLSSQTLCKACVLLNGLNKARARTTVTVDGV